MGGLCSSGDATQQIQASGPPQWMQDAGKQNFDIAKQIASQGYQPYGGQRIAGFTNDQLAAQQGVRNAQGLFSGQYAQAGNAAGRIANSGAPMITGLGGLSSGPSYATPQQYQPPSQSYTGYGSRPPSPPMSADQQAAQARGGSIGDQFTQGGDRLAPANQNIGGLQNMMTPNQGANTSLFQALMQGGANPSASNMLATMFGSPNGGVPTPSMNPGANYAPPQGYTGGTQDSGVGMTSPVQPPAPQPGPSNAPKPAYYNSQGDPMNADGTTDIGAYAWGADPSLIASEGQPQSNYASQFAGGALNNPPPAANGNQPGSTGQGYYGPTSGAQPGMGYGTDPSQNGPTVYSAANTNGPAAGAWNGQVAAQIDPSQLAQVNAQNVNAQNVSTTTLPQSDINQYISPYVQGAIDPVVAELTRQSQTQQTANDARAAGAGAFGGSRQALMDSETQRNLQTQIANVTGQGYQQAYNTGLGQFNTDQARLLQAAQANQGANLQAGISNQNANLTAGLANAQANNSAIASNVAAANNMAQFGAGQQQQANLANQQAQLQQQQIANQAAMNQANIANMGSLSNYRDIAAQQDIGQQQQALNQQNLNTAYQDFLNQKNYPIQMLNLLTSNLNQTPYLQSVYGQPPNGAAQGAGLFASLLSAFGPKLFGG